MNKTDIIILGTFIVLVIFAVIFSKLVEPKSGSEQFDIPLRSSSAWDWNLGPGYGAGYGTGYAMWGVWPATLPKEPWKNWMWGRRPLVFRSAFTPVPQIDYNNTPTPVSGPISNYTVTLIRHRGIASLSVNGFPEKTLQLDRNRNYYFHIYVPGSNFTLSKDGKTPMFEPVQEGSFTINFTNEDPDVLYYMNTVGPKSLGVIYLNNTRWV